MMQWCMVSLQIMNLKEGDIISVDVGALKMVFMAIALTLLR